MGAPPAIVPRLPWWTLGLVSAALLAQWSGDAANLLVYDRSGVLGGELWRIATGHLVHFSAAHLLNNLAVLVPAVWLVETRHRADAGPLLLTSALAIGIALLAGEPRLLRFGGASGVALAFLTYACLRGLHEGGRWKTVCIVLLAIIGAKFIAESAGWRLHDWQANQGFAPVLLSHVVGVATGATVYLWRFLEACSPLRKPVTDL